MFYNIYVDIKKNIILVDKKRWQMKQIHIYKDLKNKRNIKPLAADFIIEAKIFLTIQEKI